MQISRAKYFNKCIFLFLNTSFLKYIMLIFPTNIRCNVTRGYMLTAIKICLPRGWKTPFLYTMGNNKLENKYTTKRCALFKLGNNFK